MSGLEFAAPIIGAAVTGAANFFGGQAANAATADSVRRQIDWQRESQRDQQIFNERNMFAAMGFNATEARAAMQWQDEQTRRAQILNFEEAARARGFSHDEATRQMQFQRESVANQENFQREMFRRQTDYTTEMSNTAYQRAMADMRAAGLNPILASRLGGASTPLAGAMAGSASSGASGQGFAGTAPSAGPGRAGSASGASSGSQHGASARFENVVGPAVATALQTMGAFNANRQVEAAVANTNADTAVKGAQKDYVLAQTQGEQANTGLRVLQQITEKGRPDLTKAEIESLLSGVGLSRARTGESMATTGLRGAETSSALQDTLRKQFENDQYRKFGLPGVGTSQAMGTIHNTLNNIEQALGRAGHQAGNIATQGAKEGVSLGADTLRDLRSALEYLRSIIK